MIKEGKNALADAERTVIEGGEKRNGDEGGDIGRRMRGYLAGGINSAREEAREQRGKTKETTKRRKR